MAPPPRPPIICYDLQTTTSKRRTPCITRSQPSSSVSIKAHRTVCVPRSQPSTFDNIRARDAYIQKVRVAAEEKERRIQNEKIKVERLAQLDALTNQLESANRFKDNLLKKVGLSHSTAKYIQKQDEENARLRQKIYDFSETRSKELGLRVQQLKRFKEFQQDENNNQKPQHGTRLRRADQATVAHSANGRRFDDMSLIPHNSHILSSTSCNSLSSSPLNTDETANVASSSSTISISSCASSLDESSPIKPRSNSHIKIHEYNYSPLKNFSFYKGKPDEEDEILEITDVDFFSKVEDKTMIEVNELINRIHDLKKILQ